MPLDITPDEALDITAWDLLGAGIYNQALCSRRKLKIQGYTCLWVLKKPKDTTKDLSASYRAVRKWKELNPEYPAHLSQKGMLVPYLGDTQASDAQIASKLVEIYLRTRNILLDAFSPKNFLSVKVDGEGDKCVCIDMDQAFRRGSFVSDRYGRSSSPFTSRLDLAEQCGHVNTAAVIRTLLYMEKHLTAEQIKDDYISLPFIKKLRVLCKGNVRLTPEKMEILLELMRFDTANEITDALLIEFVNKGRISAPAVDGKSHIIHGAAKHGLVNIVRRLVASNPSLAHVKEHYNQNPLQLAVSRRRVALVTYFIAQGVDVFAELDVPSTDPYYDKCKHLTALDLAINLKNPEAIALLARAILDRTMSADTTPEQKTSMLPNFIAKLQVLRKNYLIMTSENIKRLLDLIELDKANEIPDAHLMEFFNIERISGFAVNGKTHAIHLAAKYGLLNLVRTLLTQNTALVHLKDASNRNPLYYAARRGQGAVFEFLYSQDGIEINTAIPLAVNHKYYGQRYNYTILDYAILGGDPSTVEILHRAGMVANCLTKATAAPAKRATVPMLIEKLRILLSIGVVMDDEKLDRLIELINFDTANEIPARNLPEYINTGPMTAPAENGVCHIIHLAARDGLLNLVKALVKHNPKLIAVKDHQGKIPLYRATYCAHHSVADVLRTKLAPRPVEVSEPVFSSKNTYGFFSLKQFCRYAMGVVASAVVPIPVNEQNHMTRI